MTAQGLKELAQTKSPKFGHFIVEFATPGIGHNLWIDRRHDLDGEIIRPDDADL